MEAAAKESVLSDYSVLDKSCIDVASDAAKEGGLNPGTPNIPWYLFPSPQEKSFLTPLPNVRFNRIIRNNPGGTLFILPQPKQQRTGTVTVDPAEVTHTVVPEKTNP